MSFLILIGSAAPVTPALTKPVTFQVSQRNGSNQAVVAIAGHSTSPFTSIQAQATATNGGASIGWTDIVTGQGVGSFAGSLTLNVGVYTISCRVKSGGQTSSATGVSNVSVGEVFICAGQSLMASWGQTASTPSDPRISEGRLDGTWAFAQDPQQTTFFGSNGNGNGSIIPVLGSTLAGVLSMPIGFYDIAVGNTSSADWINTWYAANLLPAIRLCNNTQFRGILWSQGQNDGVASVTQVQYETNVASLIASSRSDAGWTIPWGIAISTIEANISYANIQNAQIFLGNPANVTGGQTYQGSNTDSLPMGDRFDGTHLTQTGQTAQAGLWASAIQTFYGW